MIIQCDQPIQPQSEHIYSLRGIPMNDFSALGERLKAIRDSRNLNLSDVSELTGISKAMISKIERGESVPTISTVWKLANGLKITLNALSGDAESGYAVKSIAEMTPLIDTDGRFQLYNIFPFSPLAVFRSSTAASTPATITSRPCLSMRAQERNTASFSRVSWMSL